MEAFPLSLFFGQNIQIHLTLKTTFKIWLEFWWKHVPHFDGFHLLWPFGTIFVLKLWQKSQNLFWGLVFFFADSEACLLENQLFGKTMDFDQTSMVLFDGPLFFCFFLIKLVFFLFLLLDGNQERKVHAEFFKRRMILTFFLGKKQLFDRRKNSESMSLFWFCQVLFCRTKKICCFFFPVWTRKFLKH